MLRYLELKGQEKSIQLTKIIKEQSSQKQEMLEELTVLRNQFLPAVKFFSLGLISAGIVYEIKNSLRH